MNKENLMLKTYKTIDEQIEYLRKNKRIIIDEEDKHWFKDINEYLRFRVGFHKFVDSTLFLYLRF